MTTVPSVSLREITPANRAAVEALATTEEQAEYVTGVAESLVEAAETPDACPWYRAVYLADQPVGFVMISDGIKVANPGYLGPYFLWRLLIDRRYQSRGIGSTALALVVEHVRTRKDARVLLTSVGRGPASPIAFYLRQGFRATGEVHQGELVLELDLHQDGATVRPSSLTSTSLVSRSGTRPGRQTFVTRRTPVAVNDDPDGGVASANPGPFVVSYPCAVCDGRGDIDGRACPSCRGTGVRRFFHGTKAELNAGDLIEPGHAPNFGDLDRQTTYVYFTGTLDAATWGAELALGEGRGRIYQVEPAGAIEDDPNLTDKKFPGNPTKSYRSREALRVVGEVVDWQGHSPEELKAMKDGVARARRQGVEPID